MIVRSTSPISRNLLLFLLLCGLTLGCGSSRKKKDLPLDVPPELEVVQAKPPEPFATREMLDKFSAIGEGPYRLGAGDVVQVDFWSDDELSGRHRIGPDGRLALPIAGPVALEELTIEEAQNAISDAYSPFYTTPAVSLRVEEYISNQIFILGRVEQPGALQFEQPPSLLEAISRAGSLPVSGMGSNLAALTRVGVFRGRDAVLWVDLARLLSGDASLNIPLRRNDLLYMPDAQDQLVIVLGEVHSPGAVNLTPNMNLLDALANAGGPTEDAAIGKMKFVRPEAQIDLDFDLDRVLSSRGELNIKLSDGDIIYVPSRRIAKIGYVLRQLTSGIAIFLAGEAIGGG